MARVTIYLKDDDLAIAVAAAERAGLSLSAWLAKAARDKVEHDENLAMIEETIAEIEAEHGPISQEIKDEADASVARMLGTTVEAIRRRIGEP